MKSLLGIPAKGLLLAQLPTQTRSPKFNEVKFAVEGDTTIEIKMIYF